MDKIKALKQEVLTVHLQLISTCLPHVMDNLQCYINFSRVEVYADKLYLYYQRHLTSDLATS